MGAGHWGLNLKGVLLPEYGPLVRERDQPAAPSTISLRLGDPKSIGEKPMLLQAVIGVRSSKSSSSSHGSSFINAL
jgi:hypothetical protein